MTIRATVFTTLFLLATTLSSAGIANAEDDVFSQSIAPMTTLECARCHEQVFTDLRDQGGAHKMVCRDCHETFHNFSKQLTWQQRVPACSDCHDYPHGESAIMSACLTCHSNAHAPVASLNLNTLEPLCHQCHQQPAEEMTQPSAHSDMTCSECHQDRHGYLPKCTECHEEPHSPFISSKACMQCHPVHHVSDLLYSDAIDNSACGGCHEEPATELKQGHLAHSLLNCTFCHAEEHGAMTTCNDCHDTPHSAEMLEGFSDCNDCHGNPHNLLPGS
ncbi:hypothetical protein [Desulfuromonas acetoxidans]|uniref:hypothetical protein n=1 Tax=Desulfuromonas acetoxidans TaxID=891 RepID=UPI00292E2B2F|nr:hypothetical protein [Desulfuromonas acetoxidans]